MRAILVEPDHAAGSLSVLVLNLGTVAACRDQLVQEVFRHLSGPGLQVGQLVEAWSTPLRGHMAFHVIPKLPAAGYLLNPWVSSQPLAGPVLFLGVGYAGDTIELGTATLAADGFDFDEWEYVRTPRAWEVMLESALPPGESADPLVPRPRDLHSHHFCNGMWAMESGGQVMWPLVTAAQAQLLDALASGAAGGRDLGDGPASGRRLERLAPPPIVSAGRAAGKAPIP